MIDFVQADWNARRRLLAEQAALLLSEDVEPVFDTLAAANEDAEVRRALADARALLRRCRTWGVDPVFYFELHMRLGDSIAIPEAEEDEVMQIATLLSRQGEDETALEQAVAEMESLLNRLTADAPPLFEAALLRDLAEATYALPAGHPARQLERVEMYYREALPFYQEAADRPISPAFIQCSLGNLLSDQGRYDEALEPLQAASQGLQAQGRNDDAVEAFSAYASALDYLGRTEEALSAYAQATALLPAAPPLLRNRVEVLIHARRLDEAEAELARATELDGNEDNVYLWLRRAQLALARGDGTLADQMLDEAIKRNASVHVVFLRAQSAWLRGDLQAAREGLQQVLQAANAGEQAAIRREWECLIAEHPRA